MTGIILSDDLLFASRVTATAKAIGATVIRVRTPGELQTRLANSTPGAVIVDLHTPGFDVSQARQLAPGARLIGYGSHVAADVLKAARDAGFDLVLPKSAFAERVESELADWLKSA
jgi:DNA-binding NarL/FixJ family response regulator